MLDATKKWTELQVAGIHKETTMRKEITPPALIGIIVGVVALLGVIGYFAFRSPASSGPVPQAALDQMKDPASQGKMGPNSKKGNAMAPTVPGPGGSVPAGQ